MLDALIIELDKAIRTLCSPAVSRRPHPDEGMSEVDMSAVQKRHALGLMRVNHSGEICAQALYRGQALTMRDPQACETLKQAACEELEHLAWTQRRIKELGGQTSLFNPLWYSGSLTIGVLAGLFDDKWNLGFLEETERQVETHLTAHLNALPPQDQKSRAVVEQMRADESQHAAMAHSLGATSLPLSARVLMTLLAKVMTTVSYHC